MRGKRVFDLFFSITTLLCLSPLLCCLVIAIRLSSTGSAIYRQPRLGKGGKIFTCYKFRTMYLDADTRLAELLESDPHLCREWTETQKLKHDPRIFPLGRWLRRTSLDELPQFWNVLLGDLSVVGPRPYMLSQQQELGALGEKILSVRPGITGLWQTSGRNSTTFHKRISLDASYIDKYTFCSDLLLIAKTIPQLFFSSHAY